jgi:hypothetical protein
MLCSTSSAHAQTAIPSEAIKAFEKAYGAGSFGQRYIIFSMDSARVRRGWENVGAAIEQLIDQVNPIEHFDMDGDGQKDFSVTLIDLASRILTCPTVVLCRQPDGEYSICTPPRSNGYGANFIRRSGDNSIEWFYLQPADYENPLANFKYRSDTLIKRDGYWTKASYRSIDNRLIGLEYWTTSAWVPQPDYLYTFSKTKAPMLELRTSPYRSNPTKEEAGFYTILADSGYAKLIWQMIGRVNEHDLQDMIGGSADGPKAHLVFHFADGSSKTIIDYGMHSNLTLMAFYDLVNKLPKTQWKKLDADKKVNGTSIKN